MTTLPPPCPECMKRGPCEHRPGSTSGDPDGAQVLDDVATFLRRFVVFPTPHAFVAVALWCAHTWCAERWYVTPRLILDSAEPGSGKTRVLELLALLCRSPKSTINTTTAALYRRMAAANVPLTVLMDEVDAVFGPRPTPQAEDLRALLNAGYKRGATVDRCVGDGKSMRVEEFKVFAPVALAGLVGRMPGTLTTRAVVVHMRKRAPGERVEQFRERDAKDSVADVKARLAAWVDSVAGKVELARPVMPDGVTDRPAEVWEALLALADAAGGTWPDRARDACRWFVLETEPDDASLGVRLLRDVRDVFRGADRMTTADLLAALVALDESPWSDMWGKPLDARRLASELRRYGVRSKDLKRPGSNAVSKGYRTDGPDGLADAWMRYLAEAATNATGATSQVRPVADGTEVADASATCLPAATGLTRQVAPVAPVAHESRTPEDARPTDTWRRSGRPVRGRT